jgi:predicted Zn-dependent peptidase
MLSMLAGADLGIDYLRDYPKQLEAVTVEDVQEAAATWLAPTRLTTVLVGDVSVISEPLRTLVEIETA